jgi:excisionase family DNA binding protein
MATIIDRSGVLTPTDAEITAARNLEAKLLASPGASVGLVFNVAGEEHVLLDRAADFFIALIREIARGHPVGLIDLEDDLSTTEAAELLGVSRPTLVGLLKEGRIAHRMVGTHRRVPRAALLEYKRTREAAPTRTAEERLRATDELLARWHAAEENAGG